MATLCVLASCAACLVLGFLHKVPSKADTEYPPPVFRGRRLRGSSTVPARKVSQARQAVRWSLLLRWHLRALRRHKSSSVLHKVYKTSSQLHCSPEGGKGGKGKSGSHCGEEGKGDQVKAVEHCGGSVIAAKRAKGVLESGQVEPCGDMAANTTMPFMPVSILAQVGGGGFGLLDWVWFLSLGKWVFTYYSAIWFDVGSCHGIGGAACQGNALWGPLDACMVWSTLVVFLGMLLVSSRQGSHPAPFSDDPLVGGSLSARRMKNAGKQSLRSTVELLALQITRLNAKVASLAAKPPRTKPPRKTPPATGRPQQTTPTPASSGSTASESSLWTSLESLFQ